jgi:hypothetical protein
MRAGHSPTRSAASLRALAPCQIPALSALSRLRPSPNHLQSPRDAGKRTASGPKERCVEPLALPIRARFVPFPGHPACSSDWYMPRIPGGRFLRRPAAPGRQADLVRTRNRGGQPDQPAPSHQGCTEAVVESAPPAVGWNTGARCRGERHCAGLDSARAASTCRKGFGVPSQGLDVVEPVMYLSWTDDVPIVYPF